MRVYAHTLPNAPEEQWQLLREHLENVADLASAFAMPFGGQEWARLAGLWHDLGKYSSAFQEYLRPGGSDTHRDEVAQKIDHSSAGAQHAAREFGVPGHILSYVIAGHHAGLHDGRSDGASLEARLTKCIETWDAAPTDVTKARCPAPPAFVGRSPTSIAFFVRMVFSCLVDADFLDTERFMSSERSSQRRDWPEDTLRRMESALDEYVGSFGPPRSSVDRERAIVRNACLEAADRPPGLYSLTVPTGGGKTLSSLAFSLKHANRHGLRRVVYVVPFTSIIEQNAQRFREALAEMADTVIEHHCNVDAGAETKASRLATENWDAPLVVTTSVQFYESLYSNRTSRCRKLHNLSRSVIVLDEVQKIPVAYLEPCLHALRELTANYGATVVLCTATQPALHHRIDFPIGLKGVREIIPDPTRLYTSLKRVEVTDTGPLSDDALVERIHDDTQALCIVNTRRHARTISDRLPDDEAHYHLSATMCPAHRSEVLTLIQGRLESGADCRVISTPVIEAGVDIDFPVVYRSLAGLDSIAQAAGRCNRNGALAGRGLVHVFRSEHGPAERFLAEAVNAAEQVLPLHSDPLGLDAIEHFFQLYYWDQSDRWDEFGILDEFHLYSDPALPFGFGFATTARKFRLIDDALQPVIVPWREEGRELCEKLRGAVPYPERDVLRRLQRYTVSVPSRVWEQHVGGAIQLIGDRYPVLTSAEIHYSERTGLALEDPQGVFLSA